MHEGYIGLSTAEVEKSKSQYGDNRLSEGKKKSFWRQFFDNLFDPIIKILLFALGAEILLTLGKVNWVETGGILLAVLIATTVSTASEYGSEKAFLHMQQENKKSAVRVIRNGALSEIPIGELVVGDLVLLSAGEKIPADGTLEKGTLSVDQSALNGESRDVEKRPDGTEKSFELSNSSKVFRGSLVTNGEGIVRIERVGMTTYYGGIAKDVQEETRQSPLKLRLGQLASQISKIGYVLAAFVAFTYLFNAFIAKNGYRSADILASLCDASYVIQTLIHALTLMITVIVVAVPEGLPMMITVVLCANVKKMANDGVLVKKMVGIETAGSMNLLFTDKTGTLTAGILTIDRFVTADGSIASMSELKKTGDLFHFLLLSAFANTDAVVSGKSLLGGNGTDKAITGFFVSEAPPPFEILKKTKFTSENKYSSVTLRDGYVFVKGAPEVLLPKIRRVFKKDGSITAANTDLLRSSYAGFCGKGDRVVAIAMKEPRGDFLILLAFAVLKDKLRPDAKETVKTLHRAGVQIVMVTGDGKETAQAIATECGIFHHGSDELVLDRSELVKMKDGEIQAILPRLRVVSRALPADKRRLIRLSQENGAVVGMTGDGINDAPSLKLADVGFAMGNGEDIAKDAADAVLLDNSISAIKNTVLYGRTIFKSIRKFITFQLIMNFAACGVSLVGQWIGIPSPITIVQMLWVNMIMDTLGGLAFAGEPPLSYYLNEKPKKREEGILTSDMLLHIVLTGFFTLGLCVCFLTVPKVRSWYGKSEDDVIFLTGFYALFIFSGLTNCLCCRCERLRLFADIRKNKPFVFILVCIFAVQILMIYFGGSLFRTTPLSAKELGRTVLLSLSVIPFDFVRRLFVSLRRKKA